MGTLSGNKIPLGYLTTVEAFQVFQCQKRGLDWVNGSEQDLEDDETEFNDAIISEEFRVFACFPDGQIFRISPHHIVESTRGPRSLVTNEILAFHDEGMAPYARGTPLVREDEFAKWVRSVPGHSTRRKPGPKPKVDRTAFEQEVHRLLDEEGSPNPQIDPDFRQADVERHMMQWHNDSIGETQNRTYVADALSSYARSKGK